MEEFGEKIFGNIGKKLKLFAVWYFIALSIVGFIFAIIDFNEYITPIAELEFFGLIIDIAIGIGLAFINSMLFYAFGQLVENSDTLVKRSDPSDK